LESTDVDEEYKAELRRRRAVQNPVELNHRLNEAVRLLLKLNQENPYGKKTSCKEGCRVPAAWFQLGFYFGQPPFFG
jgi:hypothetical protein